MLICSGTCPIALIAIPGLAVRRRRLLFCIGSRDAASTADNLREVSVQAVSKSAEMVLGGVIVVEVLRLGVLIIVDLAGWLVLTTLLHTLGEDIWTTPTRQASWRKPGNLVTFGRTPSTAMGLPLTNLGWDRWICALVNVDFGLSINLQFFPRWLE